MWYPSHSKRIPSETQRITSNIPVITIGDLGVVLTPSDLLASSSHNIYQSTFLKVDRPQWPKIPCADRCDEAVMASIACWENEEVYTPTYVAGGQVNRTRCMRFCFERPACVGVIHEIPRNFNGNLQEVKGVCRRLYSTADKSTNPTPKGMTFTLERNCVEKYFQVLQCSVTTPERPLAFTLKESVIQEHNHLMTHYRTKFNDIVQAYQLKATPTKHKRSIDDVLKSIPIVSHLYGIFSSPWETRKLKKHVEELQARFQSFADRITAFAKSTSSFQEEVLEVLYHTTDQIHAELESVD